MLGAAYEATLRGAVRTAGPGGGTIMLLTHLGDGVSGNPERWGIDEMRCVLDLVRGQDLGARIVCWLIQAEGDLVRQFALVDAARLRARRATSACSATPSGMTASVNVAAALCWSACLVKSAAVDAPRNR